MNPTNTDSVRELLKRMDKAIAKADPVPLGGGDATRPFLKDGDASMSGLNANLQTLCQSGQVGILHRARPRTGRPDRMQCRA